MGSVSEHWPSSATALVRRLHRLSSIFELWQEVQPPLIGGGTAQRLSLRALPGGATASVRRCNRLSSVFELWQEVQPPLTEVAPPGLGLRALAERCNRLS